VWANMRAFDLRATLLVFLALAGVCGPLLAVVPVAGTTMIMESECWKVTLQQPAHPPSKCACTC
jgi:hypothetical protein